MSKNFDSPMERDFCGFEPLANESSPGGGLFNAINRDTFICPKCNRVSHNPNDVAEKYCGACHLFVDEMATGSLGKGRGEMEEVINILRGLKREHLSCGDPFYSCPKRGEWPSAGEDCLCGADDENAKLQEAIDILESMKTS